MIYPEFEQFESFVDPLNPYCNAYKTKEGHIFYVEPGFYSGMQGFKEKREERYQDLLNGIFDVIKKNEKVIFTWSYDSPFMEKDGFIYRHDYCEVPPRVEYTLTELGESFLSVLDCMKAWGDKNLTE